MDLHLKLYSTVDMFEVIPHDAVMFGFYFNILIETQGCFSSNNCLWFPDMFFLKQKLSVEIADINSVQINLKKENYIDH